MNELQNFYNRGFGWICKACEQNRASDNQQATRSRLMQEGEAESNTTRFSNHALVKWCDETRRTLVCPLCGTTESIV